MTAQVTNFTKGQLLIYDEELNLLEHDGFEQTTMTVSLSNLPAGRYYVRVHTYPGFESDVSYQLTLTLN